MTVVCHRAVRTLNFDGVRLWGGARRLAGRPRSRRLAGDDQSDRSALHSLNRLAPLDIVGAPHILGTVRDTTTRDRVEDLANATVRQRLPGVCVLTRCTLKVQSRYKEETCYRAVNVVFP